MRSDFIHLCNASEIPQGTVKRFSIEGRSIAVYHTSDGFFASDDACPHRGGPLSEGELSDGEIICPWHFWSFDVRTGRHADPRIRIVTHDLRVDDEGAVTLRIRHGATDAGEATA